MANEFQIVVKVDPASAQKGVGQVESSLRGLGNTANGLQSTLNQVFALTGIGFGVKQLISFADQFKQVTNAMGQVTNSSDQLQGAMDAVFKVSQDTRSSFSENATIFRRLALATQDLGTPLSDVLQITKTLNQATAIAGLTSNEAAGAFIQLTQGMASGVLRGQELRSVLTEMPPIARAIATEMHTTVGNLRELGKEGKITTAIMINAFKHAADEIDQKFGKTVPTLSQAFVVLKNSILFMIGEFDKGTGITTALSGAIIYLAQHMEILARVVVLLGGVILSELILVSLPLLAAALLNPVTALTILTGALLVFGDQVKIYGTETVTTTASMLDLLVVLGQNMIQVTQSNFVAFLTYLGYTKDESGRLIDDWTSKLGEFFNVLPEVIVGTFVDAINLILSAIESVVGGVQSAIDKINELRGIQKADTGGLVNINGTEVNSEYVHAPDNGLHLARIPTLDELARQAQNRATNSEYDRLSAQDGRSDREALLSAARPVNPLGEGQGLSEAIKRQQQFLKKVAPDMEKIRQQQADLNTLYKGGRINIDQYNEGLRQIQLEILKTDRSMEGGLRLGVVKVNEEFTNMASVVSNTLVDAFQNGEDALVKFVTTGKFQLSDFFTSLEEDIARIVIRSQITGPLAELIGGSGSGIIGGIGSIFGNLFGGGKAIGGYAQKGMGYMVGEHGPEPFFPDQSGTIMPNSWLNGQGGGDVKVYVMNNTSTATATVKKSTDARGNKTIRVSLDELAASNVRDPHSQTHKAIEQTFGVSPGVMKR